LKYTFFPNGNFSKEIAANKSIIFGSQFSEIFLKYLYQNRFFCLGTYFSYEFELKECFRLFFLSKLIENSSNLINLDSENNRIEKINDGIGYMVNFDILDIFKKYIKNQSKIMTSIFLLYPSLICKLKTPFKIEINLEKAIEYVRSNRFNHFSSVGVFKLLFDKKMFLNSIIKLSNATNFFKNFNENYLNPLLSFLEDNLLLDCNLCEINQNLIRLIMDCF